MHMSKYKKVSVAERRALVVRWKASGLPCQQFAEQQGVSEQSLHRWRRELDDSAVEGGGFFEVKAAPEVRAATHHGRIAERPIAMFERHGVKAQIYADFPLAAVPGLLRALSEVRPC